MLSFSVAPRALSSSAPELLLLTLACLAAAVSGFQECPAWPASASPTRVEGFCCDQVFKNTTDADGALEEIQTSEFVTGLNSPYGIDIIEVGGVKKMAVADQGSNHLLVYNYTNEANSIVQTFAARLNSIYGVCLSKDGMKAYATASFILYEINLRNGSVTHHHNFFTNIRGCATSYDGQYVYVAAYSAARVYRWSIATKAIEDIGHASNPNALTVTRDGRYVWTADNNGGKLSYFDTYDSLPAAINLAHTLANAPHGVAISPDENWIVASRPNTDSIVILSKDGQSLESKFEIGGSSSGCATGATTATLFTDPREVAFSPDGNELVVADRACNTVVLLRRITGCCNKGYTFDASTPECQTRDPVFSGTSHEQRAGMLLLAKMAGNLNGNAKTEFDQFLLDQNVVYDNDNGARCFSGAPSFIGSDVCYNLTLASASCNIMEG